MPDDQQHGTVVRRLGPLTEEDLQRGRDLQRTRGVRPGEIPPLATAAAVTVGLGTLGLLAVVALSRRR